jgi:hypothetical protein
MENNNNNKENLMSLLSFLFFFVGGFLVVFFIGNLYIDFRNQNKDEWINIYNNENIYYNSSRIIHAQDDNVRIWIKFTGKDEKDKAIKYGVENGISAEKYNNWAFDILLWEINCKNQTARPVYYSSYGTDGIIYEENHENDTANSFSPIIPGSVGEYIYKLACENQSFLCRLPFICEIIKNK